VNNGSVSVPLPGKNKALKQYRLRVSARFSYDSEEMKG